MHKQAVEIWFQYYQSKTGQKYVMDGIQGKHLKWLLKKVEAKVKDAGMEPTEENVLNSLKGFLMHITDKWILEHLEISIVNGKFNSLYAGAVNNNPFNREITAQFKAKYGFK